MKLRPVMVAGCIILLIFIIPALSASNTEVEELEKKLGTAEGTEKVDILISLSKSFVPRDPGKALSYAQQAYNLSRNINYKQGETEALGKIGNSYYQIGDYQKCLDYHYKSLELALKIKYFKQVKKNYNVIGVTYRKLGILEKAEEMYLKVLEIQEISPDVDFLPSMIYNNLGNIYFDQKKYTKAAEFYEKALKTIKKKQPRHRSLLLMNLGVVYTLLERYEIALKLLFESLELCKADGRTIHAAAVLNIIGEVYIDTKQYTKAKAHLEQALKLVKKANARSHIMEIYETHWMLYSKMENFKKAFAFLKLYWELKDRLFSEKKSKQISEMRIKFDSERKEKENTILQKNLKIQEMKLNEQKNLRNFIIILLGISLLLIGAITNRYQAKRKSNQLLAQRNQVITRQKEELSRSERKIRAILDNAGVGISLVNRDGNFIRVNGKWADMLQHPLDQILNKPFQDFSHPEDKMKARGYFEAMLSREINDFHIETRYFRHDNTSFWGDLSATPITSEEGDVESVIFMVTDISDNKQAEFSLRESEEKYRTLVENANYGIVITRDRMIKFVNSQFTKLSGYPQIKLIDSDLSNYIVPVSEDAVKLSKKGKTFETVLLPKIGQEIDVEISAGEIFYDDHFADLLFIYDITEKKLLEKERIKNQELEFMGTLVAKITEYFNHIFSGFIPAMGLIKTSEETGLKIQRLLSEMEHSLGKVQELSKALLSLSKVRMTIQKLHLQEKLEDWIQQTKHAGMFKIKLNIPDNLWAIAANPEQIQLAFTELLNNSMKSAPPGKGLKIEAENIKVDEDSFTDLNCGKYIKLLITFQEKANQVKTKMTDDFGLVFALVYAIIKKHSGVVWMKFRDKESGPTVFEIYLPAYESSTKNIKINERQKEE